jgi:hypothetical protein
MIANKKINVLLRFPSHLKDSWDETIEQIHLQAAGLVEGPLPSLKDWTTCFSTGKHCCILNIRVCIKIIPFSGSAKTCSMIPPVSTPGST